jgi:hypothetical protein
VPCTLTFQVLNLRPSKNHPEAIALITSPPNAASAPKRNVLHIHLEYCKNWLAPLHPSINSTAHPEPEVAKTETRIANIRRALRHIAGIVFATFATMLFLSTLVFIVEPDPDITGGALITFAVIGSIFAAIAYKLLRKTVPVRVRPCPRCGSHEHHPAGVLIRRRSLFLRHTVGWLGETLCCQSRREQVSCTGCGALYFTETKSTRAWGVAAWIFLLLLLFGALAENFFPKK